jgi:hypothetical protein
MRRCIELDVDLEEKLRRAERSRTFPVPRQPLTVIRTKDYNQVKATQLVTKLEADRP